MVMSHAFQPPHKVFTHHEYKNCSFTVTDTYQLKGKNMKYIDGDVKIVSWSQADGFIRAIADDLSKRLKRDVSLRFHFDMPEITVEGDTVFIRADRFWGIDKSDIEEIFGYQPVVEIAIAEVCPFKKLIFRSDEDALLFKVGWS